jgi:hypothetical protein
VSALSGFGALAQAVLRLNDGLVQEWPRTCSGSQLNPQASRPETVLSDLSLLHRNASIQTLSGTGGY